jgi:hypothetical protein
VDEQMVYEAVLQVSEYFSFEFHDNTQKQHRKRIDQLSFRIQLAEGLVVKYANVLECKVPGQHSSDNTVPRLTERHFINKLLPSEKKARPQRWCVVCQKSVFFGVCGGPRKAF